jgi:hypothetical protein
MKTAIIGVIIVVVMAGALQFTSNDPVTYVKESVTLEVSTQEEIVIDPIDKARQELERINTELDQAETAQLEARNAAIASYEQTLADLKAKHEADLATYDAELDRIRETRVGF